MEKLTAETTLERREEVRKMRQIQQEAMTLMGRDLQLEENKQKIRDEIKEIKE